MKIKSITAVAISDLTQGAHVAQDQREALSRRPPWTKDSVVASPMARYPRYKAQRSSWVGKQPMVGCLVTASDGSWGFGTAGYGATGYGKAVKQATMNLAPQIGFAWDPRKNDKTVILGGVGLFL